MYLPCRSLSLILTLSLIGGVSATLAQTGAETRRPAFAGAWKPSDPARSERLFSVGIGWVPGDGSIVIEQTSNRLTITKNLPEARLDRVLEFQRQFYPTVIYRIDDPRGRVGGAGATGQAAGSSWQGDRLVLTQTQAGGRHITVSVLLDSDRLKVDSHVVIVAEGKESTTSEWFERIK
jgi:hypothetical protein